MLFLWYFEYITVVKISENETVFKIVTLGLQGLCDNGIFYNNSLWDPEHMCVKKNKMQLDAFGN